jgi:hypothetical protein
MVIHRLLPDSFGLHLDKKLLTQFFLSIYMSFLWHHHFCSIACKGISKEPLTWSLKLSKLSNLTGHFLNQSRFEIFRRGLIYVQWITTSAIWNNFPCYALVPTCLGGTRTLPIMLSPSDRDADLFASVSVAWWCPVSLIYSLAVVPPHLLYSPVVATSHRLIISSVYSLAEWCRGGKADQPGGHNVDGQGIRAFRLCGMSRRRKDKKYRLKSNEHFMFWLTRTSFFPHPRKLSWC